MLCAGNELQNAHCTHRGGGLISNNVLFGMLSMGRTIKGKFCKEIEKSEPEIYTNIAYFRSWITNVTGI